MIDFIENHITSKLFLEPKYLSLEHLLSIFLSVACHEPIWLWQSLSIEYMFRFLFCLQLLKTDKKVFWSVLEKKKPIFKIQTLSKLNWLMRCIGHLLCFYLITDQMWTLHFRTVLWLVEIYYLTVRISVVLRHTIVWWCNKKKASVLGFRSK